MAPVLLRLEPGQVERPRRQPPAIGPARGPLSAGGSAGLRPGRNPEAPLGATHRCPEYLPRDAVRSSDFQLVKCSGLRCLSVCLLTPLPWAARSWPSPVLTGLVPSAGWATAQGRRHKKVTDWARQAVLQLARWLPGRQLTCLGESGYAVLALLATTRAHATWLTRLRLDAALHAPAPARVKGQWGQTRVKGARLPGLAQVAAATTDCRR